jgi:hypothetical protein
MNQIIRGILIIYVISTLFYLIYTKYTDNQVNKIIDNLDEENKEAFKKINRYKILVFILGILVGLGILIFIEPETINKTIFTRSNVSDISDINVIS